jgi:hypothetical protein
MAASALFLSLDSCSLSLLFGIFFLPISNCGVFFSFFSSWSSYISNCGVCLYFSTSIKVPYALLLVYTLTYGRIGILVQWLYKPTHGMDIYNYQWYISRGQSINDFPPMSPIQPPRRSYMGVSPVKCFLTVLGHKNVLLFLNRSWS